MIATIQPARPTICKTKPNPSIMFRGRSRSSRGRAIATTLITQRGLNLFHGMNITQFDVTNDQLVKQ